MLKKIAVALVVAGLAALTFRGFLTPGTAKGDRVETGLTYITLGDFLQDVPDVDAVAFYDEGPFAVDPAWYVIPDPSAARDLTFGYREGRLLDQMFGGHVTIYCASDGVAKGKNIWALKGGEVVKHLVFCNRRRMDLANLVPAAVPAHEVDETALTEAEYRALLAKAEGSDSHFITLTSPLSPHAVRCGITFPFVWEGPEQEGFLPSRVETAVGERVAAALAGIAYDLDIRSGYASSYVMHAAEGMQTSEKGWAVNTPFFFAAEGEALHKVPGLSIFQPDIRLQTSEAGCAAFEAVDLAPLWRAERDVGALEMAFSRAVTSDLPAGEADLTEDRLRAETARRRPATPITYRLRYLVLDRPPT